MFPKKNQNLKILCCYSTLRVHLQEPQLEFSGILSKSFIMTGATTSVGGPLTTTLAAGWLKVEVALAAGASTDASLIVAGWLKQGLGEGICVVVIVGTFAMFVCVCVSLHSAMYYMCFIVDKAYQLQHCSAEDDTIAPKYVKL